MPGVFEMKVEGAEAAGRFLARAAKRVDNATRAGVRKAGSEVRKTWRQNASFRGPSAPEGKLAVRTGDYRKGLKTKTFKFRNGEWAASVRVRGRRGFVMRLHETGYQSRGGSNVPARAPGQAALGQHAKQIPAMIRRFVDQELRKT